MFEVPRTGRVVETDSRVEVAGEKSQCLMGTALFRTMGTFWRWRELMSPLCTYVMKL